MRGIGIGLIILGVLMFVFNGFDYKEDKNVANIGPVHIDKTETKHIGWPVYGGAVAVIAGIVVLVVGAKKDL
jgi:hypothetical protein